MRLLTRFGIVCGMVLAALSVAGPSVAQLDIPWTWNSNDYDAAGEFKATGEHFYGADHHGGGYLDWSANGYGSSRWTIPGSSGTIYDLNLDLAEGRPVSMQLCQLHTAFPDDCSATKWGVS